MDRRVGTVKLNAEGKFLNGEFKCPHCNQLYHTDVILDKDADLTVNIYDKGEKLENFDTKCADQASSKIPFDYERAFDVLLSVIFHETDFDQDKLNESDPDFLLGLASREIGKLRGRLYELD